MWNDETNELGRELAEDADFDSMRAIRWFFAAMMVLLVVAIAIKAFI